MNPKKKILIADDDPDILEQVSLLMQGEGYEVLGAHSQEEAEEALLTAIPDLAIFDLMMENRDSGFVLCHHVKRLYPETPVIILTAVAAATGLNFSSPSPEVRSWIKADTFLNKPVRPEQLRAEVHRLLDR